MFRKLVSNLPFNPSLLGTVSFYAKRIKGEESLRRLGFGFVALAMFIQTFAVIAPPEKSLAYSSDYIINGLRTRDDILRAWDGRTADRDVAAIYGRFGLTRADIEALPMYPNVTVHSNFADYWTIGRTSLSASSKSSRINSQYKSSEVPVTAGGSTVYLRQLRAWDIVNPVNKYRAFEGWKDGKQFWILVDCGNFTQVGKPPLTPPGVQLRKTIEGSPSTLKPGDRFTYRFEWRNPNQNSVAEGVNLSDAFPQEHVEIVQTSRAMSSSGSTSVLNIGSLGYSANYHTMTVAARVKPTAPHNQQICNSAKITSSNGGEAWGGPACFTVVNPPKPEPKPEPCPYDSSIPKSDSRCVAPALACVVSVADINRTSKTFKLRTTVSSTNQYLTSVQSYVYDFGDGSAVQTKRSTAYSDETTHVYQDGSYTATVVINYQAGRGAAQTDQTVSCSAPIDSEPDQPLSQEKTARNLSQNIDEEKTLASKVKAGEIIEYSLITHNSYDYDRANVNVSDYIGDILDYADLDKAFLTSQGGTFDEATKTINWKAQTVKANSDLANKFRVQVKSPIPSTNQPSAMTTAFDCKISNKFGNQLDIDVDCPLPKSAEYITERLPNTGPGTSLIIGFVATVIVAYFFARSRLLAQELDIIRTDFAQTGGV